MKRINNKIVFLKRMFCWLRASFTFPSQRHWFHRPCRSICAIVLAAMQCLFCPAFFRHLFRKIHGYQCTSYPWMLLQLHAFLHRDQKRCHLWSLHQMTMTRFWSFSPVYATQNERMSKTISECNDRLKRENMKCTKCTYVFRSGITVRWCWDFSGFWHCWPNQKIASVREIDVLRNLGNKRIVHQRPSTIASNFNRKCVVTVCLRTIVVCCTLHR